MEKEEKEHFYTFQKQLEHGKRTILYRLLESFLREDILHFRSNSFEIQRIGNVFVVNDPEFSYQWEQVSRILAHVSIEEGKKYLFLPVSDNCFYLIPFSTKHAFYRYQLEGDVLFYRGEERVIPDCVQLFNSLFESFPRIHEEQRNWEKLLNELMNGSVNLALSYTFFEKKKSLDNRKEDGMSPIQMGLYFEQLCTEGHHLHPGTKTKMGMEVEDVVRYAPELNGEVDIKFVAVKKDCIAKNTINGEDSNEILMKQFPSLHNERIQKLIQNEYALIPVHSWQFDHVLFDLYEQEIKDGTIVPLKDFSIPSKATTSFRTVVPDDEDLFVKLAVHSQMTSTTRSISIQTAMNGPVVSRLIQTILGREKWLASTFIPIHETFGIGFLSNDRVKSRNLTAMIREGISKYVKQGEIPVPASSFHSVTVTTEKRLLEDLFDEYCKNQSLTSKEAAESFIYDYCQITLPGYLTFMVKYGIGVEGHLQNSVVVFQDGKPVKLLFRDWGGSRIYKERLEKQGITFQLYPHSVSETDDVIEMFNKMHYTVFQSHIGEVIRLISSYAKVCEKKCWNIVKAVCERVLQNLQAQEGVRKNVSHDRKYLFAQTVDHKALTKMRLYEDHPGYLYVKVPNPLHE